MSQLVLFRHPLERSLHSQLQVFSEYSSAQNVIMTHMIILKKSTTMFLEKVIFLIAYHLCLTFMFFEHEEFSLHQKRWKTSKYSEPVKTI